jgi:hypothetical protein
MVRRRAGRAQASRWNRISRNGNYASRVHSRCSQETSSAFGARPSMKMGTSQSMAQASVKGDGREVGTPCDGTEPSGGDRPAPGSGKATTVGRTRKREGLFAGSEARPAAQPSPFEGGVIPNLGGTRLWLAGIRMVCARGRGQRQMARRTRRYNATPGERATLD